MSQFTAYLKDREIEVVAEGARVLEVMDSEGEPTTLTLDEAVEVDRIAAERYFTHDD